MQQEIDSLSDIRTDLVKIANYNPKKSKFNLQEMINQRNKIDGLELLSKLDNNTIKACFFDPQYRGILDKMNYGNEVKTKEKRRSALLAMTEKDIEKFLMQIDRVLMPSGHLFLWIDKFHLCEGVNDWFVKTSLEKVDLVVWEKTKIGMGYRTRNKCEFLIVLQKKPTKVKGVWSRHDIPNVWKEAVKTIEHPHAKPIDLQTALIDAISQEGDLILDPAMGSGSVLTACQNIKRNFIGGDING